MIEFQSFLNGVHKLQLAIKRYIFHRMHILISLYIYQTFKYFRGYEPIRTDFRLILVACFVRLYILSLKNCIEDYTARKTSLFSAWFLKNEGLHNEEKSCSRVIY